MASAMKEHGIDIVTDAKPASVFSQVAMGASCTSLLDAVCLVPAMILSVLVAWLIARTDMPGGNALEFLCWMAYFVPDFLLVLAWILLLDSNFGFFHTLALYLPFVDQPIFNPYSFWGTIWVHTSTGGIWFKVMLLTPVFRRLGAALEEAARDVSSVVVDSFKATANYEVMIRPEPVVEYLSLPLAAE